MDGEDKFPLAQALLQNRSVNGPSKTQSLVDNDVTGGTEYQCGGVSASYDSLRLPFIPATRTPLGLPPKARPGETPACAASRHALSRNVTWGGLWRGTVAALEIGVVVVCVGRLGPACGVSSEVAVCGAAVACAVGCAILSLEKQVPSYASASLPFAIYVACSLAPQLEEGTEAVSVLLFASAAASFATCIGFSDIIVRQTPLGIRVGVFAGLALLAAFVGLEDCMLLHLDASAKTPTGVVLASFSPFNFVSAAALLSLTLSCALQQHGLRWHGSLSVLVCTAALWLHEPPDTLHSLVGLPDFTALGKAIGSVLHGCLQVDSSLLLPILCYAWVLVLLPGVPLGRRAHGLACSAAALMGGAPVAVEAQVVPLWPRPGWTEPGAFPGAVTSILLLGLAAWAPVLAAVPAAGTAPAFLGSAIAAAARAQKIIRTADDAQESDAAVALFVAVVLLFGGCLPLAVMGGLLLHLTLKAAHGRWVSHLAMWWQWLTGQGDSQPIAQGDAVALSIEDVAAEGSSESDSSDDEQVQAVSRLTQSGPQGSFIWEDPDSIGTQLGHRHGCSTAA